MSGEWSAHFPSTPTGRKFERLANRHRRQRYAAYLARPSWMRGYSYGYSDKPPVVDPGRRYVKIPFTLPVGDGVTDDTAAVRAIWSWAHE